MEKLRVLQISTLFPSPARPGFGLFVARQAQALAERDDVEVVVINPLPHPPFGLARLFSNSAERGVPALGKVREVEVHYPRFTYLPRLSANWNPALIARAILPLARRLHAENPFDVVDAQFFFPDGPAAARIAAALGLPLSIKARGSDIHLWGRKAGPRSQMLEAARQAAGLRAVSAALKHDMVALGMEEAKIQVIYTGLDAALFHPRPRDEARAAVADIVPTDGTLLVSVGNLIPLKGQHLVIDALAQLPGMRLVCAGKGPEAEHLAARAAKLGLADRVHLSGSLAPDRVAQLVCAANAMVLPSEREGLANAWVEALACGTPIVITDVGGAREVLCDPVAGRFVKRDAGDIARGIREIVEAAPDQAQVAKLASRFSWESKAAILAADYRALAEGQAAGAR